jgi:hypothetical protein
MRGNWAVVGLVCGLSGLAVSACSGAEHDCSETRTCHAPVGYIDAGNFDNWWSAGASGEDSSSGDPQGADADAAATISQGGEGGESPADPSGNGELARVSGVSPADGATGVDSDAEIVITFSGPVDESAIEAAYQSSDLPAAALTFVWNAGRTALTLKPKSALTFQAGAPDASGAVSFPPKTYHYGFNLLACATSNALFAGCDFSFSTLRQASSELAAIPSRTGNWTDGEGEGIHDCLRSAKAPYVPTVCIGDDSNNVRYTGFVSIDLSPLPVGIVRFSSARLTADALVYGSPSELGPSLLEHVAFGVLSQAALTAPTLANFGAFYSGTGLASGSHLELSEDVASAVTADYASRRTDDNLTQYRLSFANIDPEGVWDDIELPTSGIQLSTIYLLP